ncbi:hypothetical protein GH714_038860 [Hevea brasiliensis]|uniref:(+)-neomenthol dehydrogenase-like n=1 Tax=Hevea brasiliensis TaxID=3981 RepID=A0A6A6MQ34_HEVBR|nr:hypothetical protein GH714_038860 [Hevea brasiliensis]
MAQATKRQFFPYSHSQTVFLPLSALPASSIVVDEFLFFIFFFRYAVVTGANKGIGFEICRQLASNGIVVVLTARDEKRGLEAFQKLKDSGFSDLLVFHQLDVADAASIAALVDFIKTKFGKLDIMKIPNEWAKDMLVDVDNLSEERIDEVLSKYLKDFKEGSPESNGWPAFISAYRLSKQL